MADDDTTEVLRKADALMRRTRVFVAGSKAQPEPAAIQEDDLPVLTEVVPEHEAALTTAPPHMQQHLDALREELSLWLEQELPNAVLTVTDGLADQLMGELTEQAEKNLLPRLIARLDGSAARSEIKN
jgi:GTPase Era involved in 16S rRNA processing